MEDAGQHVEIAGSRKLLNSTVPTKRNLKKEHYVNANAHQVHHGQLIRARQSQVINIEVNTDGKGAMEPNIPSFVKLK